MNDRTDPFHHLVLAHVGLIRHIGTSTLRRQRELDDYVQSVIVAVYTSRDRVRYMAHLERWIAGVARNVARNWNRKREPAFTSDLPDLPLPAPPMDEVLSEQERWTQLLDALAKLSPQERELVRSYYLNERTSEELARRFGISQVAIYKRLERARQSLRRQLGVVSGLIAWFFARPEARAFGQVPRGSDRMSTALALMTSTLTVGLLGFSAHHVEQAVADLAMVSPHGDTFVRITQLDRFAAEFRPKVSLIAGATVREDDESMSKVSDIQPMPNISTAVGALHGMMQGVEQSEWSLARLQGVLGHAFSFEMKEGAGDVWQEANLDWGWFFDLLPDLGHEIRIFDAKGSGVQADRVKRDALAWEAWEAVRASIDRGIPAVAWSPMSREQQADGLMAACWGLLVGYDESDETYTVRHQYVDQGREAHTVRYDGFGHNDTSQWFCVLAYHGPEPVDAKQMHVKALRNAVAFANGTRYDPKHAPYPVDARGFAAYQLWREAIDSGVAIPEHSQHHARGLGGVRRNAAAYLRELIEVFPAAASDLQQAAGHYDRLVETSNTLHDLCGKAKDAGAFSDDARAEARDLVTAALEADKDAIGRIEAALAVLEESE
jgi:RNA polymerase sigma-70 factor (ECF subfamily)